MTNTVHFFVSGRVQGVGFRRFVNDIANKNNLTGWVRNTPDNAVEIYAKGQTKDIINLIDACQKGPTFAFVEKISFSDKNPPSDNEQGLSSFFIWR